MNELMKVQMLVFTKDPHEDRYTAYTPFGSYGYKRGSGGNILAYFEFGGSQVGDLALCGDAITAQRLCNGDYTNRIKEALGLGEKEAA
jgi:hypothetical protein